MFQNTGRLCGYDFHTASCILSVSLSGCLNGSCKVLITNADLYQSLHYLKAHIQDKADILFHTAELLRYFS